MKAERTTKENSAPKKMQYSVLPDRMPRIPENKMDSAQAAAANEIAAGPRGGRRAIIDAIADARRPDKMPEDEEITHDCHLQISATVKP